MPLGLKVGEIAPGPTAEIEDAIGRLALDGVQQGVVILADVVIPCALPEAYRRTVVMAEGECGNMAQPFVVEVVG